MSESTTVLAQPVKPVVKRAPRKRDIFFKREKEEKSFIDLVVKNTTYITPINNEVYVESNRFISPYTDFIPLTYLFLTQSEMLDKGSIKYVKEQFVSEYETREIPSEFFANMFFIYMHNHDKYNKNRIIDELYKNINNYINYTDAIPLNYYLANDAPGYDINDFIQLKDVLKKRYYGRKIEMSDFHNSLYYLRDVPNSSSEYIPTYISVILPENYLYQKYHILVTGKVDPNKVIVLVNDDIDHPSFSGSQSIRKYHKAMLNNIISQGYQTWNVPESFILQNCFINNYKIKAKSRTEIQQKIEELSTEFSDYMRAKYATEKGIPESGTPDYETFLGTALAGTVNSVNSANTAIGYSAGYSVVYNGSASTMITPSSTVWMSQAEAERSIPVYLADHSHDLAEAIEEELEF